MVVDDNVASLPDRLARAITLAGPISLAHYMAAVNAHYYGTRDPLGTDFTTAPEISQMFGELIGLWLADLWDRAGQPASVLVELGPGRGTLAVDALRAMAKVGLRPAVHLVETSPVLRAVQASKLPDATWHDTTSTLPETPALLVIANEFFDALPIRQLVRGLDKWHERLVACQDTLFLPIAGKPVPDAILPIGLRNAPPGSVIETSPASVAVMRDLTRRLSRQGGAMLTIDYGYEGPAVGDTLQAMRGGRFTNPFETPGEHDLTAHVDFATLRAAAEAEGARAQGPVDQGPLLVALGIDARAATLGDRVRSDRDRLVSPDQMGTLFKAIAITAPHWPLPSGFA